MSTSMRTIALSGLLSIFPFVANADEPKPDPNNSAQEELCKIIMISNTESCGRDPQGAEIDHWKKPAKKEGPGYKAGEDFNLSFSPGGDKTLIAKSTPAP